MKYDFTTEIDRCGMDSIAANACNTAGVGPRGESKPGFERIPMWIADMSFPTAPSVINAMSNRLQHPIFGYFSPPDNYYNAIINWHKTRNNVHTLEKQHIGYENSVLGGVASALDALCIKGDAILIHSPTYVGFTNVLKNSGYEIVHSPLYIDNDGIWRMNYEDMDAKIKQHKIHTAIFCSPHNPSGRVWQRDEIEKAMDVYRKNNVFVISDEIWSDILLGTSKHVTSQSINEDAKQRTVALYAPSKTFNLAGLVGSYHVIYNTYLKDRIMRHASLSHYNNMNVLSMHALIGAYSKEGEEWLIELLSVLNKNIDYAFDFISQHFSGVKLVKPEGTYLMLINCEEHCKKHNVSLDALLTKGVDVGVLWQDGRPFNKDYSIRMNLALPHSQLIKALDRLDKYVFNPTA